jgi:hypothetical protein
MRESERHLAHERRHGKRHAAPHHLFREHGDRPALGRLFRVALADTVAHELGSALQHVLLPVDESPQRTLDTLDYCGPPKGTPPIRRRHPLRNVGAVPLQQRHQIAQCLPQLLILPLKGRIQSAPRTVLLPSLIPPPATRC